MTNQIGMLKVTSALTAFLFSIHVVQDYVRGLDKFGPQSVGGVAILLVWLLAAVVWPERRAGQVIMAIVGLLSTGITVLHMKGSRIGEVWKSDGAFWFIWVLIAFGVTGTLSFVLALRALLTRKVSALSPAETPS